MTYDTSMRGAAAGDDHGGDGESAVCNRAEQQGLFPRQPVADRSKGRMAFLLVLICYAVIDYGRLHWLPLGPDTGHHWEVFYASYAELVFHNDLAHWFPYGLYGQPNTLYNLMDVTSTNYLVMLLGKVFQVKNALLLFQLSLMADHLLFLFGIHLLARSLFRRHSTVWLCLIGSIAFLHAFQLPFTQEFRMAAWYPLILYFLVRFFRDHRAEGLWMAGTVFTFSCLGNSYEQPYVVMGVLPFVVAGCWKHPGAWRDVFRCRAGNLITMVLFAAAVSLYLYMALHVLEGVVPVRPERAGSAGIVPVEEFLGRGNQTVLELLISLFAGNRFYVGLLPVGCVLWGLYRARNPLFTTLMASTLLLVWFSMGGLFSLLFYYHVPFFSLIHHIDLSLRLVPVLLLLAAGAAWDAFTPSRKDLKLWLALPVIIFFALDLCLYADAFALGTKNLQLLFSSCRWAFIKLGVYGGLLGLAAVLSLVLRSARQRFRQPWQGLMTFRALAVGALLTGLFVDVFQYSYQSGLPVNKTYITYRRAPTTLWRPVSKSSPIYQACYVHPLTWQGERLEQPDTERKRVATQTPSYFYTYGFAQFDPCRPEFPPRAVATAMQKLLALRNENDQALMTILGCHAPKLRLLRRALYVKNEAEAEAAVRTPGNLTNVVILEWPANTPRPPMRRTPLARSRNPGSIEVTDFGANAIQIQVDVAAPRGAWLVYADAYDPRWLAWVNGKSVPVVPAYVGLKAVRVPTGKSVVQMKFSARSNWGVRVLAVGGALCSLSLLVFCGICCVRGFPPSRRKVSGTLATPSTESGEAATGDSGTVKERLKPQTDTDKPRGNAGLGG